MWHEESPKLGGPNTSRRKLTACARFGDMNIEMRASFEASMDQLLRAIDFVEAFGVQHGLRADDTTRLVLMVEELFTNTATHGVALHVGDQRVQIDICLACRADQLTLEYADSAPHFDPLASLQRANGELDTELEGRAIGHMGLPLVLAMATSADYAHVDGLNRLALRLARGG